MLVSELLKLTIKPMWSSDELQGPEAPRNPLIKEYGTFRNLGVPCFGVLIIRILLLRLLYQGPLVSETPIRTLNYSNIVGSLI